MYVVKCRFNKILTLLIALLEVMKNSLFVLFLVLAVLLPTCELKRVNKKRAKKKAAKSSNGGQQTRIKDSNVQLQVMSNRVELLHVELQVCVRVTGVS